MICTASCEIPPDVYPQKNAKAPLSDVYDNKSALEQMHCALLIQAMRHHGLGKLLDRPDSGFRKMLAGIVLATDMSVHYQFIRDFQSLVDGRVGHLGYRITGQMPSWLNGPIKHR
jgi:hypothetical protein